MSEETINVNGLNLTCAQWDQKRGFKKGTVSRRIKSNKWSHHDAVNKPLGTKATAGRKGAKTSPWRYDGMFCAPMTRAEA